MLLGWYSRTVTRWPKRTIALVLLLTAAMIPGVAMTTQEPDALEAFVPQGTPTARALDIVSTRFPASGGASSAQVVVRGDVTSPEVIREVLARSAEALAHPDVAPFNTADDPVRGYAPLIVALAGVLPDRLSEADVAQALATDPADDSRAERLQELITDDVALVQIVLQRGTASQGDLNTALLTVDDVVRAGDYGPGGEARTLSNARFQQGAEDALGDSQFLFPLALVVIVMVLWLLFRSFGDTLTTVAGVVITALWQIGLAGYLGPGGLDRISGTTPISIIVPVLLVGLTVDYSLQTITRYREARAAETDGEPATAAARAIATAGGAIALGAVSTSLSFLTNLASPLPPIRDFGVLAAFGIAAGFLIMTSFVPSTRILLDRRRAARGRPARIRAVVDAIPGVRAALRDGTGLAGRRPLATLAAVGVLVGFAAFGALGVSTEFNQDEFLPENSEVTQDLRVMRNDLGGRLVTLTGVVSGDLDDPAAARALVALEDELRTDSGGYLAGPLGTSLVSLTEQAAPDARQVLLTGSQADIAELYRRTATALPDEFAATTSLGGSDQKDATLLQLPAQLADEDAIRQFRKDVEGLWGSDEAADFTLVGPALNPVIISDEIARSQTVATGITILAAFVLLTGYFWRTHRRPVMGLITVVPILAVLVLLLGVMRLLDINYNALTALLTSLIIGVGVDYTIHVAHRYLYEREHGAPFAEALRTTATTVGGALFGSAATTALGFAVLATAPLLVVSQLGLLTAATVVLSLLAGVVILPPLLAVADRRRNAP